MYDTVHFLINKHEIPNKELNALIEQLKNCPTTYDTKTDEMLNIRGNFKNLKIEINNYTLKISGSLPKFLLGNNIEILTCSQVKEAITKISQELGVDIRKAKVVRLDISACFFMKNKVEDYFPILDSRKSLKRSNIKKETLMFINKSKEKTKHIMLYDKTKEMEDKGSEIPDRYKNKNILRYEIQIFKRIKKELGISELTADLLFDKQFYNNAIEYLIKEYERIEKKPTINFGAIDKSQKSKEIVDNILIMSLFELSKNKLQETLDNLSKEGVIKNKASKYRIKKMILDRCKRGKFVEDDSLKLELDKKIYGLRSYKVKYKKLIE